MPAEDFYKEQESKEQNSKSQVFWLNIINETVREVKDYLLDLTNKVINTGKATTYKVEVTNQKEVKFPQVQKVELTNHKDDSKLYDLLEKAINKQMPEPKVTLNVPDKVEIKNFPKYPEFPKIDIPKSVEVSNMGQLVKQIEKIVSKIPSTVTIKQSMFDRTPKVEVKTDVKPFVDAIEGLGRKIDLLLDKDTTIDQTPIVDGLNDVKKAVNSIDIPVSQSPSSWHKSKDMQSMDCAKTIVFVGSTEDIDYVEFIDDNGHTYRKTYLYDGLGRNTGWTRWIKQ